MTDRVDLSRATVNRSVIMNTDLSTATLSGATFDTAVLSGSKLIGQDLQGARILRSQFLASDLTDCDLTRADVTGCNFKDAALSRARFDRAQAPSCPFVKADLGQVSLRGARLFQSIFIDAVLTGADLSESDMRQCVLHRASEGAQVVSEKRVGVVSAGADLHADEANLTVGALQVITRIAGVESEALSLVAERVDAWMTRLSQKVQRVYRAVEDFEQVRAGRVDYSVKTSLSMHAENTTLSAQKLVHLDGEQIHLG